MNLDEFDRIVGKGFRAILSNVNLEKALGYGVGLRVALLTYNKIPGGLFLRVGGGAVSFIAGSSLAQLSTDVVVVARGSEAYQNLINFYTLQGDARIDKRNALVIDSETHKKGYKSYEQAGYGPNSAKDRRL